MESMQKLRKDETETKRNLRNQKIKEAMKKSRKVETEEERNLRNQNNMEAMQKLRKDETETKRNLRNQKNMEAMQKSRNNLTELDRLLRFQQETRYGPIFVCSSCDQKMFQNNVCGMEKSMLEKLQQRNIETFDKVQAGNLQKIQICTQEIGKELRETNIPYICFTCKKHLNQGKVPPMSRANGLELVDLKDNPDLNLSELENNLISKRLLFQKIYQLPRSRMAGCKDRLINIPINDKDVLNTVEKLPRTPKEAGLLEIKLKRKMEYENFHKKEFVNPTKIFTALQFLREKKHPSYLFFEELNDYENRCKVSDPLGYDLVFVYEDGIEKIVDIDEYLANLKDDQIVSFVIKKPKETLEVQDTEEVEDIECMQKDPTRKFQFEYNKSACMVDKFPEAAETDRPSKENESLSFAPGEGKIPENILMTDNWDIDAFPMKYPDGKNGLHQEKDRKLTDQYHFVQRLRNKDNRFSFDPAYVFASAAYLENKQLQRNVNVSFNRGKKCTSLLGGTTYSLEDGFSVFDKISNTPSYWKTAKYEMLARLENLGPFQFFFTLSCADSRWDENFSSILRSLGVKIKYEFNSEGHEITKVMTKKGEIELREYLDDHINQSRHEIIRTSIMNATRNYNHRVKAFIKNIVMDKSNPMAVKYYSTKVEFQGRGAGHNHGTLWVDLKKMETYFNQDNGNWAAFEDLFDNKQYTEHEIAKLRNDLKIMLEQKYSEENLVKPDPKLVDEKIKKSVAKLHEIFTLHDEKPSDYNENSFLSRFPLHGLTSTFRKFQTRERLLPHEEKAIINFVNRFTTCTLNPASIAGMTRDKTLKEQSLKVVNIVKCANIHHHTKTCRKYDITCRFKFGKFPIWKTLISKPSQLLDSKQQENMPDYKALLKKVRNILDNDEIIQSVLSQYPDKELECRKYYETNRE